MTNTLNDCTGTAQASATSAVNCVVFEGCTPGYWKNRKASWNKFVENGQTRNVKACVIGAANAVRLQKG